MKLRSVLILFIIAYTATFFYSLNRSLELEFNGELISLLPADNDHLSAYNKMTRLNSSEGGFNAIIRATNGESIIEDAREITNKILLLELEGEPVFKSAELVNDLYDIKYSALYLMTGPELDEAYEDLERYIEDKKMESNPYYVDIDDNEASLEVSTGSSVLLDEVAHSKRYTINEDSTIIRIHFLPAFPKSDFNKVELSYELLLNTAAELEENYGTLEIHWGGSYVDHFNKINDVQYSVSKALIIGVLCLLIFMVGYMIFINRGTGYKSAYIVIDLLLVFIILFSGFIISLGIFSFLFYEINVFTGIIFSILFGINLDYILHVYSINKNSVINAADVFKVILNYVRATRPIILSCLTTGLAIISLIFADFDGFHQVGIIFFINIIVNLISTYLFLLLSPSNKYQKDENSLLSNDVRQAGFISKTPKTALIVLLLTIGVGAFFGMKSLSFNFNFSDLEPESEQTDYKRYTSELSSGSSYHEPSYFMMDSIEDSRILFSQLRDGLDDTYTDIERVESFSARYPVNLEMIESKSRKIDSLISLINSNEQYLESADTQAQEYIEIIRNTVPPTIAGLPEYITNRFFFEDNTIAPMVIIYPKMSLSNGETSIAFRKSSGSVELATGETYYAASTSMIASSILELLIEESTFLFVTPLATIFVLLLLYYRSFANSVIAISPLLLTFLILLAIKSFLKFDINLYNVIVFPILIGVGADNGIHLVDSLRNHKESFLGHFIFRKFPVLSACSFTTILGFIGLLFINHPGMESVGVLAIAGITVTLFSTFFISVLVNSFHLQN
ncbi:MAG: MMPL family transporter [Balneolaceae bacterium]